ncbi:hypothetical protein ElyMa_000795800 [Elysia marginata]|uniref:Uncharacterized protein n=1 Tax=Elysia marginata TaxID=1093978 RepID=A0AAV4GVR8_9GAST|nr:hypothetical protein ElyMa_000795800 [Elysia marginata]
MRKAADWSEQQEGDALKAGVFQANHTGVATDGQTVTSTHAEGFDLYVLRRARADRKLYRPEPHKTFRYDCRASRNLVWSMSL